MKVLRTGRLALRQWYLTDAADLFEYASDQRVGPSAGWRPHQTIADSELLIRSVFQMKYYHWAIVLPEIGKVIGGINLLPDPKRTYLRTRVLGYSMNPAYWGRGIMPEAVEAVLKFGFDTLRLQLISAFHYPANFRSQRVLKKTGFSYEGRLRSASQLFDGSVVDNVCYSITPQEYAARQAGKKTACIEEESK